MLSKSAKGFVVSALVLLSFFAAAPQPAHGTPPGDLHFELDLVFQLGNFTGTGSWHSLGIL